MKPDCEQNDHHRSTSTPKVRRNYARWRAASLILVYVLMALHIAHWKITGKTLAPLELNEVMYTLELGIVTAGFLFMVGVTLATALFGRVFCSWGCHMLALQDLCAWILSKLRIKPHAVRSRLLLWVPVGAAIYMFVWPQATRLYQDKPLPELHFRTDEQGWASLTTENLWRNLPGPAVTISTFAICGFLVVYVLGSRGFCTYGCPYGAVFRLADRVAPMRIRTRSNDCLDCGACTAACSSHVRVHEELHRFGTVVNPACLKDLDCVAACPQGKVYYGLGLPAIVTTARQDTPVRKRHDFSLIEEGFLLAIFLIVLVVYRGLYDQVPFLLSLALGAIAAYATILLLRSLRRNDFQANRVTLRRCGRWTLGGRGLAAMVAGFWLLTFHSGWVHYHTFRGSHLAAAALTHQPLDADSATVAISHLEKVDAWGLVTTPRVHRALADLHYQLAGARFHNQQHNEAEMHLRAAARYGPPDFRVYYDLGGLLLESGRTVEAIHHFRHSVQLRPEFADGHYNLALALWMRGSVDEARREIDAAVQLNPDDSQSQQLHALMHAQVPLD